MPIYRRETFNTEHGHLVSRHIIHLDYAIVIVPLFGSQDSHSSRVLHLDKIATSSSTSSYD